MLKETPERLSYAQDKLIKLIKERKLRQWCLDNDLVHSVLYRLAYNEQTITYKLIASMCHLISPIEWLYYTDEKLPYEPVLLPKWTPNTPCKYISEHQNNYMLIAKKYNIPQSTAYKMFISHQTLPTAILIRQISEEVNPIDFFTGSETVPLKKYIPDRGDIIKNRDNFLLVISKKELNEKVQKFICCKIEPQLSAGIKFKTEVLEGTVCSFDLITCKIDSVTSNLTKIPKNLLEKVLNEIQKNLE